MLLTLCSIGKKASVADDFIHIQKHSAILDLDSEDQQWWPTLPQCLSKLILRESAFLHLTEGSMVWFLRWIRSSDLGDLNWLWIDEHVVTSVATMWQMEYMNHATKLDNDAGFIWINYVNWSTFILEHLLFTHTHVRTWCDVVGCFRRCLLGLGLSRDCWLPITRKSNQGHSATRFQHWFSTRSVDVSHCHSSSWRRVAEITVC